MANVFRRPSVLKGLAIYHAEEAFDIEVNGTDVACFILHINTVIDAAVLLQQGLSDFAVSRHIFCNPAVFGANAAHSVVFNDDNCPLNSAAIGFCHLFNSRLCGMMSRFFCQNWHRDEQG